MSENSIYVEELHRFFQLWRHCNAMYEEWSRNHGFSCNEILVLTNISENKNCTQKMVSESMRLSKQTVNMILKRFEQDGLVSMEVSEKDKRSKIIHMTEKGCKTAEALISELITLESETVRKVGIDNFRLMNDVQEKYISNFSSNL